MSEETPGSSASVFIATSMDGFIARDDGGIDWLSGPPGSAPAGPPDDFGYESFFNGIDALVMGRNTFELVLTFPEWPYGEKPLFVLTSRKLDLPQKLARKVEVMSGSPREVVDSLAGRGLKHLYIDGGVTIQRFLEAGLIDRMIISRIPVLLGRGKPLFGPTPGDIWLRHVTTRAFAGGLVQSEYRIERSR